MDEHGANAVRFAIRELNAQGGLLGKTIEPVDFDTNSTPLGARNAARAAVAQGVVAAIGASWSSHSLAAASVLQEAGVPMISPASTNPEVTLMGNYIFRACFTDPFQGKVMARFALDQLHAKTAVVLTNVSQQFSRDLARFFISEFSVQGNIPWEGDYTHETTDFLPLLKNIQALDPDVVFIPGYPRDSAYAIKQAHDMGLRQIFLGGDGWNYKMGEYAGDALDGNFFCDHWHEQSSNIISQAFVERYNQEMGPIKIGGAPLAYDAMMLLADAVTRANSLDRAKIRDALAATKGFEGVTGTITMDANGDPIKPAVILKFVNARPEYYMTVEP